MRSTVTVSLLLAAAAACAPKTGSLPSSTYTSVERWASVTTANALYVVNYHRNVLLFNTKTRALIGSLQPSMPSSYYSVPVGIALDPSGNAYVSWASGGPYGGGEVDVYSPGSTKLSTSISSVNQPLAV